MSARLGHPRVHYRYVDSTNTRARELAHRGAPHGTLVTAAAQSAGRGRQGRVWTAPAGRALLCSLVVRDPPRLLPLAAGVAVAEVCADTAQLKWPNDVWVDGRKVAGILVEGRPQEGWAVVGVGMNVAVQLSELPVELRETAGTLGLEPSEIEPVLARLLGSLERWLGAVDSELLEAVRARDALRGRRIRWADGEGIATGIDDAGNLVVETGSGQVALRAGEVHLLR